MKRKMMRGGKMPPMSAAAAGKGGNGGYSMRKSMKSMGKMGNKRGTSTGKRVMTKSY